MCHCCAPVQCQHRGATRASPWSSGVSLLGSTAQKQKGWQGGSRKKMGKAWKCDCWWKAKLFGPYTKGIADLKNGYCHPVFTFLQHAVLMWVFLSLCLPHVGAPESCSYPCRWLAQKVPSSEEWMGILCFVESRDSNLLSPIIYPFSLPMYPLFSGQVLCTTALEIFFFQNVKDLRLVTDILPWLWQDWCTVEAFW